MARIANITFTCRDPNRLADFWIAALGYVRQELPPEILEQLRESGFDMTSRDAAVDPEGRQPRLFFIKGEKTPTTAIPIHLDIGFDDPDAAVDRLIALGATVKERKTQTVGPWTDRFTVMQDPEGNSFCVQGVG
jgi:predicted enzyme related to lactoylglutathione lyase